MTVSYSIFLGHGRDVFTKETLLFASDTWNVKWGKLKMNIPSIEGDSWHIGRNGFLQWDLSYQDTEAVGLGNLSATTSEQGRNLWLRYREDNWSEKSCQSQNEDVAWESKRVLCRADLGVQERNVGPLRFRWWSPCSIIQALCQPDKLNERMTFCGKLWLFTLKKKQNPKQKTAKKSYHIFS